MDAIKIAMMDLGLKVAVELSEDDKQSIIEEVKKKLKEMQVNIDTVISEENWKDIVDAADDVVDQIEEGIDDAEDDESEGLPDKEDTMDCMKNMMRLVEKLLDSKSPVVKKASVSDIADEYIKMAQEIVSADKNDKPKRRKVDLRNKEDSDWLRKNRKKKKDK